MDDNFERNFCIIENLLPLLMNDRQVPNQYYPTNDDMLGLTEKQKELRHLVFDFAQEELKRSVDKKSKEKSLFSNNRKLWNEFGKLGLLGITVKEKYGGKGGCFLDHVIIQEELSRACTRTALSYSYHTNHCVYPIHRYGTEEQKLKYLPKLCSGEYIGVNLVPDIEENYHAEGFRAEKQAGHYVLNGLGCSYLHDVDIFIVMALTNRNTNGMTVFIVERSFEGCLQKNTEGTTFQFHNCKVPVANKLGEKNKGYELFVDCVDFEAMVLAGGPVGLMQALCDVAFEYAHSKKLFTQFKYQIASLYKKLSVSRNYLYTVARAYNSGYSGRKDSSAVSLFCTENALDLEISVRKILGNDLDSSTIRLIGDVIEYQLSAGTNKHRRRIISENIQLEYST